MVGGQIAGSVAAALIGPVVGGEVANINLHWPSLVGPTSSLRIWAVRGLTQ